MAAGGHRHGPAVVRAPESCQPERAEAVELGPEEHVVELVEQPAGLGLLDGEGADGVPDRRGDHGGLGALAAHVTDDRDPVALAHLEDVVEVAADLVAGPGRAVRGRDVEPRHHRGSRWDQRLLQRPGQHRGPLLRLLGSSLRVEQLLLVVASLGCREHRDAERRARRGVPVEHGVHEDRQTAAVGAHDVERDLLDATVACGAAVRSGSRGRCARRSTSRSANERCPTSSSRPNPVHARNVSLTCSIKPSGRAAEVAAGHSVEVEARVNR